MVWLPEGEKNFEDIFIRFDATHERGRRTDRHRMPTIYRAYAYASRGKKHLEQAFFYVFFSITSI